MATQIVCSESDVTDEEFFTSRVNGRLKGSESVGTEHVK